MVEGPLRAGGLRGSGESGNHKRGAKLRRQRACATPTGTAEVPQGIPVRTGLCIEPVHYVVLALWIVRKAEDAVPERVAAEQRWIRGPERQVEPEHVASAD